MNLRLSFVSLVSGLLLCGCAVSQGDVEAKSGRAQSVIDSATASQKERASAQARSVVRLNYPYLSSRSTALSREARMPEAFRRASGFVRPMGKSGFTITEIAELITKNYGVRVRIRPDVFILAGNLVPGSGIGVAMASGTLLPTTNMATGQQTQQIAMQGSPLTGAQPMNAQSPYGMYGGYGMYGTPGLNSPYGPQGAGLPQPGQYGTVVDFDFTGSLSDYLQRVSAVMGITAEWDDANQELTFYRLHTRTYTLDTTPMKTQVQSALTKATSSTGNSGTLSGQTQTQMAIDQDTWEAVEKALNTIRTRAGSVVVNRGTRTITVIDTRDVIEIDDRFMAQQNEVLSRQVILSVRMVRVALNKAHQSGFSFEAAYNSFINGTTNPDWTVKMTGAGSLATSTASNVTLGVVNAANPGVGTQIMAQFLNTIGNVVDEFQQDVPVRNNRTVPITDFGTFGYLSKTTPAIGSTVGGSAVPGLETSTVTSGTMLMFTPSIKSNESLVLQLGFDRSADPTFDAISTGSGATFQQVQLLRQKGLKIDTEVGLRNNETLVLMGTVKDGANSNQNTGLTGYSQSNATSREIQLLMITPRIVSGS